MKTREKLLVHVIMKLLNLPLYSDIKRGYLYNKIFSNLHFEDNVYLRKNIVFYGRGELKIGENSFINEETFLDISSNLIIGKNVNIGMRAIILTSTHKIGKDRRCGKVIRETTIIEDNVWIGAGALIYPGVKIAKGSIIAAGEVVYEDVEENVILKRGKQIKIDEKRLND